MPIKSMTSTAALSLCVFLAIPATRASAAEQPGEGRRLGGHDFIQTATVPGPFITTEFDSATGGGILTLTVSGTDLSLAAATQAMQFQVAATPWLALRVGGLGSVVAGIDETSAVAFGALVLYDIAGGASVGWRFGNIRVAGSFDIEGGKSYLLSPAVTVVTGNVLHETNVLQLKPGAQVAVGLSPVMGVFGHLRLNHESTSAGGSSTSTDAIEAGAGASFDLMPVSQTPLGFLVFYNVEAVFSGPSQTTHTVGGGVYYTGRRDLSLGAELSGQFMSSDADSQKGFFGQIVIRYFW